MVTTAGRNTAISGVVLLVVGAATGWVEVAYLGVAALVAFVVAFAWSTLRARIDVERHLEPQRVTVGDPALGVLTVRNSTQRPTSAMVANEQIRDGRKAVEIPRIKAGAHKTLRYRLPTERRAVLSVGPLVITRSDPLGLVASEREYGDVETLFVHPRRHALLGLPSSLLRSLEGPTTDTAPSGTVSFHTLREYVPGDDRRHIHWKTSARTGTLMVKQLVDTSLPDLTLLIDLNPARWTDAAFEVAMEAAASMACACTDAGFPVRIHTSDGANFVHQGADSATQYFLDRLAGIDPVEGADLRAETARLAAGPGGVNLVLVTRDPQPEDLRAVVTLQRRYRSILAVDADPDGAEGVRDEPGIRVITSVSGESFAAQWNAGAAG